MEPTDTPEGAGDRGRQGADPNSQDAAYPPGGYQPEEMGYQPPADYGAGGGQQYQGYEQYQGYQYSQDPSGYPPPADYQQAGYAAGGYPQPGYPDPTYGQQPGYPPGGGYPPPPAAGQPGAPATSRQKLYLIVGAAAVVVALLVVGGIFLFGGGDGDEGTSPEAVVSEYLHDLADGKADAALALGTPPDSTTFVTAAILKQQQKQAKISNIQTVGTEYGNDGSNDRARVHTTYMFGRQSADEYYTLTKTDGDWLMDKTTNSLTINSSTREIPGVTLYGIALKGQTKVNVFPGPLTFGTTNKNFAVTTKSTSFAKSTSDYVYPQLSADLSSTGKQAVQKALETAMQECAESHSLRPENCPNRAYGGGGVPVDESANWTAPTDYGEVRIRVGYTNPLEVRVTGLLVFKVSYKTKEFLSNKVTTRTDEVKAYVYGTVDLSKSPVTFSKN